jgi:hypothetical protein
MFAAHQLNAAAVAFPDEMNSVMGCGARLAGAYN